MFKNSKNIPKLTKMGEITNNLLIQKMFVNLKILKNLMNVRKLKNVHQSQQKNVNHTNVVNSKMFPNK